MKQTRLSPDIRAQQLLDHALAAATERGFNVFTWVDVAGRADVSEALVRKRLGPTLVDMKRDVMELALQRRELRVIADGIAVRHAQAVAGCEADSGLAAAVREVLV